MLLRSILLTTIVTTGLAIVTPSAMAATFNLTFSFSNGFSSSSSGTGSITINDSALVPNFIGNVRAQTTAFNTNFNNLSTTPSSTIFSLSNLDTVGIVTNSSGNVTAFSFNSVPGLNTDGYRLNTGGPGSVGLLKGTQPTVYSITFQKETPAATPEPGNVLGLLTLGTMGLLWKTAKKRH